jgi:hypothetical protein
MNKSQPQAQSHNYTEETSSGFFNLHTTGCGYLGRIRVVDPSKSRGRRSGGRTGKPFLACAINAMHGSTSEPNYTYFDLVVSGQKAVDLVTSLQPQVDAKHKVFVAFKIGDIYSQHYERALKDQRGNKTGEFETASMIKGRLLLITHVAINDEVVYRIEDDQADAQEIGDEISPKSDADAAPETGLQKPALQEKPVPAKAQAYPVQRARQAVFDGEQYMACA